MKTACEISVGSSEVAVGTTEDEQPGQACIGCGGPLGEWGDRHSVLVCLQQLAARVAALEAKAKP